jgi:hypothetical protein
MAKIQWQCVAGEWLYPEKDGGHFNAPPNTERAKVPGGWLLRFDYAGGAGGMTFVPDPKHNWPLEGVND